MMSKEDAVQIKLICATLIWRDQYSESIQVKAFCKECGVKLPTWSRITHHFGLSHEERCRAKAQWLQWDANEDWNGKELEVR